MRGYPTLPLDTNKGKETAIVWLSYISKLQQALLKTYTTHIKMNNHKCPVRDFNTFLIELNTQFQGRKVNPCSTGYSDYRSRKLKSIQIQSRAHCNPVEQKLSKFEEEHRISNPEYQSSQSNRILKVRRRTTQSCSKSYEDGQSTQENKEC
jgi:hypothetical protein